MSIATSYEPENMLVVRTVEGPANIRDFITILDQTLEDPRFIKGMDAIWDFTRAELPPFTADEISGLIRQIQQRSQQRGSDYRIALVAPQELVSRMARVFQVKGNILPANIRILYSMQAARQWLANLSNH